MNSISLRIAQELDVKEQQVIAAVTLLDEGSTVPFISRYRKEVTGGLDDSQMRKLEERLQYLREMEDRRTAILKSIDEQGKLTPELSKAVNEADTKNRLEDLYLPYKPKRRTKGQIAIEAGLEPLADALFKDPTLNPDVEAAQYLNGEGDEAAKITDVEKALEGARFILMERFAEQADLIRTLREYIWENAQISTRVMKGKESEGAKFRDYFEFDELIKKVPSHRALAIFRGRNEKILSVSLIVGDPENQPTEHPCETIIATYFDIKNQDRPADAWLKQVVQWAWRVKLLLHLETDLFSALRATAEEQAIKVFADNLKDLLLAAPAGQKATMGLDPGLRTGVKVAVVDATGKVLDHAAIFPTPPQNKIAESASIVLAMCKKHNVNLIAIGNGTASRETEKFVGDVLKACPELNIQKVMVNEAGASVYSASELAAKEFPDLDVTIRGAVSIARRLQDPLAELVKIDPKSIGVGQYQHDVSQLKLSRSLDLVVEDCVNAVGVEVNTASSSLLCKVSGLNPVLASNIVQFRDKNGAFKNRKELLSVARFGDKTYEQAAGFLRIANGDNPLDASAVHPESYKVVEKIAAMNSKRVDDLIGDSGFLKLLTAKDYVDEQFGVPTVTDIISELDKPGRDPRPEFKTAQFKEGVEKISDLSESMILEGTVTNVTNFGAFVDVGVHQDGLVHISAMSHKFITDPREVVKAGDIIKVKVMEVDAERKRIALSMRLNDEPGQQDMPASAKVAPNERKKVSAHQRKQHNQSKQAPAKTGTMAALFEAAQKKLEKS